MFPTDNAATQSADYPIQAVLPTLVQHFSNHHEAILHASPGAGKTTLVPLALLATDWIGSQKIILLEPRRLAAKAAAQRMADLLGEPLGNTVGYRIRQEQRVSHLTRIEVVTEGILTRMLQTDPALEQVAMVIFDEFHERSLHADTALALCLQSREIFRDETPLKLLIMSATLEIQALEHLLQTTTLQCPGRSFPLDIRYQNLSLNRDDIVQRLSKTVQYAIANETGDILVFLPGQAEIRQLTHLLMNSLPDHVTLHSLYGAMDFQQQQQIIRPIKTDKRRIILTTSVAQTSLTIEGIDIVIDSGLSREARFDANTATTRLHTRLVTQAEAEQRAGRAGRTKSGIVYRWWSAEAQQRLAPQAQAEIRLQDLSTLVLELSRWGIRDIHELTWLDTPPNAHLQQAHELLQQLGFMTTTPYRLTELGQDALTLAIAPRLAKLLLSSPQEYDSEACWLASLLLEGDPLKQQDSALETRLLWLKHPTQMGTSNRYKTSWQHLTKLLNSLKRPPAPAHLQSLNPDQITPYLLAHAYPDRIGKRQANSRHQREVIFKLANGRMVQLRETDSLASSNYIIAVEVGSRPQDSYDTVYLACALPDEAWQTYLQPLLKPVVQVLWPKQQDNLMAVTDYRIGKLSVYQKPLQSIPTEARLQAICDYIRDQGLHTLPWQDNSRALQARVAFHHTHLSHQRLLPEISDNLLLDTLETWLGPYLIDISHKQQLKKLDLHSILLSQLDWPQQQWLNQHVPTHLTITSGRDIEIDYRTEPPSLHVKLQEMFGCIETPTIAGVPIKLALLSPAQRPLAITQDLAFFWREVYPEVKKEMKGRYPKHPWPDDPMSAVATHLTKRALNQV